MSYAIAMTLSAVSLVFLTVFMLTEMQHAPVVIDASRIAVSASNITNFELKEFISYLSLSSFISFWMASVHPFEFHQTKTAKIDLLCNSYTPYGLLFGNISIDPVVSVLEF